MENLFQDLRYGLRTILVQPGYTLIAVLALAIGIGANTAVFSIVNGVLLSPLHYKDSERLIRVWETTPAFGESSVSYLNFRDWQDQNTAFEHIAAYRQQSYTLTGGDFPEQVSGRQVSTAFFSTLGVAPQMGRDFQEGEDQPGTSLVAIVTDKFWKSRLGGDPSVLNKPIVLDGNSYTVVGVLPATFHYYDPPDVYTGIRAIKNENTENRSFHPGIRVVGKLKPGATIDQARVDLGRIAESLAQQYPDSNGGHGVALKPLREAMVGDVGNLLMILMAAVALVLLIACANVANLLLARSASRWKEMAIRCALGASRIRIVRQLLTESVILALVGGALGLAIAWFGTGAIVKFIPDVIPRSDDISVDKWVLGFTLAASLVTGLLFGLAPAIQASRPDLNETLKEGSRGSTGLKHRVLSGFVVLEIAIALVLLAGAGLLVRTFVGLQRVNPGFEARNLLTFEVAAASRNYKGADQIRRFFKRVAEDVRAVPGIKAAGLTSLLPLNGNDSETQFYVSGKPHPALAELPNAMFYITSPGYDQALRIPLLKGRFFNDQDNHGSATVAVIDEEMARLYFADEDPIGKAITIAGGKDVSLEMQIVGIVGHVKQENLDTEGGSAVRPQMYLPFEQVPDRFLDSGFGSLTVVARTANDPVSYIPAIRERVRNIDKDVPVFDIHSMDELISTLIAEKRFILWLLGSFAVLALVLASVGIYGVMSYSVTERTHEIGIRTALGAGSWQVLGIVVGDGLKLALIGVAAGTIGAVFLTRLMAGMLYGVSPRDPLTLAAVAAVLTLVAVVASFLPARRATKVDPIVALRYE